MTPRAPRNVAASVRQRLLNRAKADGGFFQDVLVRFGTERLLYRLSQSKHRDGFLLKGAVLFAAWAGAPHRPSRDADLLGLETASPEDLVSIFREIAGISAPDDGLVFDSASLEATDLAEEQDYPGTRLKMRASLDGAVIPLQVDIAFGQAVAPEPELVELPTVLDFPAPRLRAYPPEAVVSEKFEALVKLGMGNSRLKDFYDLWYLLSRLDLNRDRLAAALTATFTRRRTALPIESPAALTSEFFADTGRQRQWKAFLDRAGIKPTEQPTLEEAMATIRESLMPIVSGLPGVRRG